MYFLEKYHNRFCPTHFKSMYVKALPHLDLNIYNYVANAIDNLKEMDIVYKTNIISPSENSGF